MTGFTEEQQLYLFDKFAETAVERLVKQFTDETLKRVVIRVARERLTNGVKEFGDVTWRRHPDKLMVEIIEELADAIVYCCMRENARSGGPGSRWDK